MRMHFNACAVKAHCFQLDFNDIFPLQLFKKALKNSILLQRFILEHKLYANSHSFSEMPSFYRRFP